jgi:hypothetical protein
MMQRVIRLLINALAGLWLVPTVACGGNRTEAQAPNPAADTQPAKMPPGAVSRSADLDGDGKDETVTLEPGMLRVGSATYPVKIPGPLTAQMLQIVALDKKDRSRQLLVSHIEEGDEEDPGTAYQLFSYDGKSLSLLLELRNQVGNVAFPGDGTARITQSDWDACRNLNQKKAPRYEMRWERDSSKKMVEKGRKPVDTVDCENLAACPRVYVVDASGKEQLAGEILRDLRGSERAALQSLALTSPPGSGRLRVRLREEKSEVTHLDQVFVTVDGRVIPPRLCRGENRSYCEAGGATTLLHKGDVLDLEFDLGPEPSSPPLLWARGFYQPL